MKIIEPVYCNVAVSYYVACLNVSHSFGQPRGLAVEEEPVGPVKYGQRLVTFQRPEGKRRGCQQAPMHRAPCIIREGCGRGGGQRGLFLLVAWLYYWIFHLIELSSKFSYVFQVYIMFLFLMQFLEQSRIETADWLSAKKMCWLLCNSAVACMHFWSYSIVLMMARNVCRCW